MTAITYSNVGGSGLDQEGKMNLKILNNDVAPIVINDRVQNRSAGYYFTNGRGHVFSSTAAGAANTSMVPFRYSWN
ncbi:hypothetical protein [Paraflavitalea speifideaquila]|uniref:hypothetical protein n=1 Tax=Paraflavitalea speifideaquila TaxID=3076558 RepID=UPI0028E97016|nr:hypothetical protein [Paraflavitalea speifideiaquila]